MLSRSRPVLLAAAALGLAGTAQAADPPYSMPTVTKTVAVPVVSITGGVARSGALNVSEFRIQGAKGTVVRTYCRGKHCPYKKRSATIGKSTSLRVKGLERTLQPGTTITVLAAQPGQLGKFLRYKVRAGKAPLRTDSCLLDGKQRNCFKS